MYIVKVSGNVVKTFIFLKFNNGLDMFLKTDTRVKAVNDWPISSMKKDTYACILTFHKWHSYSKRNYILTRLT